MVPAAAGDPGSERNSRLIAVAVAAAGLVLYACTRYPHPDWLDSPALATAMLRLGPFHPPGSPLAVLTGHLSVLWPFGSPQSALGAYSAVFAAASLYVFTRLAQDLWRHLGPGGSPWPARAAAALAGIAFGLAPGLWSQAVRLEVYTPALLLFLLALREIVGVLAGDDEVAAARRARRAAAVIGMGLAVHPLVALPALAGALPVLTSAAGRRLLWPARRLLGLAAHLLLGAAPLVLLPLMVHDPVDLRWGDPASLGGFFAYVTGSTFANSFTPAVGRLAAQGLHAVVVIGAGLGLPALFAALMGLYLLGRTRLRVAAAFGLALVASALTLALQRTFRLDNPDVTGYALPATAVLLLALAGGMAVAARLLHRLRPETAWIAVSVLALAAGFSAAISGGAQDRSACHAGRALALRTLERMPPGSVAVLADFNLVFMLDYLTRVEGLRPDVRVIYLRDLDNQALREALALRDPELESLLPRKASPEELVWLREVRGERSWVVDAGPHLRMAALRPVRPAGLVWILQDEEPDEGELIATQTSFFEGVSPPVCGTGEHRDARTAEVVTWHAFWQGREAANLGMKRLARATILVAGCASPDDQAIAEALDRLSADESADCVPAPWSYPAPARHPDRPSPLRALLVLFGLAAWLSPWVTRWRIGVAVSLAGLVACAVSLLI